MIYMLMFGKKISKSLDINKFVKQVFVDINIGFLLGLCKESPFINLAGFYLPGAGDLLGTHLAVGRLPVTTQPQKAKELTQHV